MERYTIGVGAALLVLATAILMRNFHWWVFATVAVYVCVAFCWAAGAIERISPMIKLMLACAAILFIVLPAAGGAIGYDPWICFLIGVVLMFAGLFAGIALFAFRGEANPYDDKP